ncbi:MAG TPA: DUF2244 domain-containing protein [Burkholderiaceae bacterium]|nr:DUF2244 domain-containing protein [Burkholderiaceae bacterium]
MTFASPSIAPDVLPAADPHVAQPLSWDLRANCALTPRQCLPGLWVAAGISGVLSLVLWVAGYPFVLLFALLELIAFAAAVVCYARHARDGERVTLRDGCLEVEQQRGQQVVLHRFDAAWVRLPAPALPDDAVVLQQGARSLEIGRHLRPLRRRQFERELGEALRQAGPSIAALGHP